MPACASSAKRDGTASGMKPATALIQAASLVLRSIGARQSAATRNCAKARLTQNDVSSACTSQISEETPPGRRSNLADIPRGNQPRVLDEIDDGWIRVIDRAGSGIHPIFPPKANRALIYPACHVRKSIDPPTVPPAVKTASSLPLERSQPTWSEVRLTLRWRGESRANSSLETPISNVRKESGLPQKVTVDQ